MNEKLACGSDLATDEAPRVDADVVRRDYALDKLDPTQRAFAERVLSWATKLVRVYKAVQRSGEQCELPRLRS